MKNHYNNKNKLMRKIIHLKKKTNYNFKIKKHFKNIQKIKQFNTKINKFKYLKKNCKKQKYTKINNYKTRILLNKKKFNKITKIL